MNNTTTVSPALQDLSTNPAKFTAILVASVLCSLLTVTGNVFVILAFVANRSLRNFSNYLILNLAISDFIVGLFSMNIYTVNNLSGGVWIMGRGLCKAWLTVDYIASNTSVMNLLVICIDRYMAITFPVKYRRKCTPKLAIILMCGTWLISSILWAPAILLWELFSPQETYNDSECFIPFLQDSTVLTLVTAFGAFYIPAFAMCMLYWRVIVKIRRRTPSLQSMITRVQIDRSEVETRNLVKSAADTLFSKSTDKKIMATSLPTCRTKEKKEYKNYEEISLPSSSTGNRGEYEPKLSDDELHDEPSSPGCDSPQGEKFPGAHQELRRNPPAMKCHIQATFAQNCRYFVKAHPVKVPSTTNSLNRTFHRINREKRATTLLKSILICFIILWLPYNLLVVITAFCGDACKAENVWWQFSYWLCYLNSTINPLCYGYCNENFQRTFKALVTTKWWTSNGQRKLRSQYSAKR